MKKTLAIFLTMAVLVCAVPHVAFAANFTDSTTGITYELNDSDKTATLTNGIGTTGAVVIPESVNGGYIVTAIGSMAFYNSTDLTSVTIPSSVNTIEYTAFNQCYSLTSIIVDSGNKNFKADNDVLFSKDGTSLVLYPKGKTDSSYIIPDSVTTIGSDAFSFCSGLTSVTIPNSVTTIGSGAFSYCSGLTSIEIPGSVTTIDNYTFSTCIGLTSITIPNSVTSIGDNAFSACSKLASITIPDSVTTIGKDAFSACIGLTSVTIPCNFDPGKFEGTRIVVGDNNTFTIEYWSGSGGTFVFSHDDINKVERREPDCVNDGEEEHYKCSGCNTLYDDAAGEKIISEDSLKLDKLGHDFGEWETTKAATCTTAGEKTKTCKNGCGESQTEPIPATGHKLTKTEKVEPTCVTAGTKEHYKCKRCDALFRDEAGTKSVTADGLKLEALGHDWDVGEVTTAATPGKPGVKTYTCSRCGETKTEPVEYIGVPGGGDGDSTDSQPGTTGGNSNSTSPRPDAGGGDSNSTNPYSDAEPAAMAKRASIKTGDQLGLWAMFDMALLLISVCGALVGVKSRRKRDRR